MPFTSVQVILDDASSSSDPNSFSQNNPPRRVISLNPSNNWSVDIGRATTSHLGPNQASNNARFGSKVMSREHAVITADPGVRRLYVTDTGSMHGTHVHGRRLQEHVRQPIADDDTITFGAVVDRGDSELHDTRPKDSSLQDQVKYNPVQVQVSSNWLEVPEPSHPSRNFEARAHSTSMPSLSSGDPRLASDYSDEEHIDADIFDSDSEIERELRSDPVDPPRRFAVPESDLSEDMSSDYSEEAEDLDHEAVDESPSSSPCAPHDHVEDPNKDVNPVTVTVDNLNSISEAAQTVDGPCKSTKLSIISLLENEAALMSKGDEGALVDGEDGGNFPDDEAVPGPSSLHVPALGIHQRDPSPSDAALARTALNKPSSHSYPGPLPPLVHDTIKPERQSQRSESAWTGHNQVLYEPLPPVPVMATGYPPYTHPNFAPPAQYFHPWQYDQPQYMPEFALTTNESYGPTSRKRKAGDMSQNDVENASWPVSFEEDSSGQTGAPSQDAQVHIDSVPSAAGMSVEPLIVLDDGEGTPPTTANEEGPARKKQRRNKDDNDTRGTSRRKTFVKYAATAFAGATLGAIGAVLGLATLPPDYFV